VKRQRGVLRAGVLEPLLDLLELLLVRVGLLARAGNLQVLRLLLRLLQTHLLPVELALLSLRELEVLLLAL